MTDSKINTPSETPIGAIGIALLLVIIVVVPLAIAIWDIGEPIKGFNGFTVK